ncbi:hypothetical protein ACJ72_00655 [Emergomyces africanus]|uniref:Fungal lipase-type domain-containing protein n=1 Tax=Emergomyces africanus TaxID=1955775 RepID=A0A1B7P7G4_9EURO|nr:hypothetical protein ACJ72_00655 [Emergomyces africanus]
MKSSFILVVSAFLQRITATALPEQRPHYYDDTLRSYQEERTISKELFSSLEELSRIVDITYCVGTTGVYKPFTCAGRCHEFEGFELVTTWNTGPLLSDSCGFVVLSHPPWPKRIIIGFRGTYSIANTIVDLSAVPQIYAPYPAHNPTAPNQPRCNNCTVHAGFMASWQNARHTLLGPLKQAILQYPDYQLVLVGHSLGGAVAALAGLEFQVRGWHPQVTTFGEPMVGNQGLVDYIDVVFHLKNSSSPAWISSSSASSTLHHDRTSNGDTKPNTTNNNKASSYHRVTHVNDPVPLLPLSEWGYRPHAGEIYVSKSDLPPALSDLRHCFGDMDPECSAGSQLADKHNLNLLASTPSSLDLLKTPGAGHTGNDDDDHMDDDGVSLQQREQLQEPLLSQAPILAGLDGREPYPSSLQVVGIAVCASRLFLAVGGLFAIAQLGREGARETCWLEMALEVEMAVEKLAGRESPLRCCERVELAVGFWVFRVLVVMGIALPAVLAHSGAIQIPAMVMSILGGLLIYVTIISFSMFFQEQEEF